MANPDPRSFCPSMRRENVHVLKYLPGLCHTCGERRWEGKWRHMLFTGFSAWVLISCQVTQRDCNFNCLSEFESMLITFVLKTARSNQSNPANRHVLRLHNSIFVLKFEAKTSFLNDFHLHSQHYWATSSFRYLLRVLSIGWQNNQFYGVSLSFAN